MGVTQFTYYRWRKEFGGLKSNQVRRFNEGRSKIGSEIILGRIGLSLRSA